MVFASLVVGHEDKQSIVTEKKIVLEQFALVEVFFSVLSLLTTTSRLLTFLAANMSLLSFLQHTTLA